MVTTGAMTKRVDRLAGAGLVTRRVSEDDGRGRVIALTPRGKDLIDRAFTAHMRNEHRLLEALTPAEVDALEPILTRWLAAFEDGASGAASGTAGAAGGSSTGAIGATDASPRPAIAR